MAFSDLIRNTMDAFLSKQYMADGLEKVEDDVDKANSKADSAVSTANNANNRVDNIVEHGGSAESTEVIDSLHDNITGTTYGHLGERLDAHSASLAEMMNDITKYGAIGNNILYTDDYFNNAKSVGNVYFPQNSTKNAIYLFSTNVFANENADNILIYADDNIILSVPTMNGITLKNVIFKNTLKIYVRDRDNYSIMTPQTKEEDILTLSDNPSEIGFQKPIALTINDGTLAEQSFKTDGTTVSNNYFNTVNTNVFSYANGYIVQTGSSQDLTLYHSLSIKSFIGCAYSCAFDSYNGNGDTDSNTKIGVVAWKDNKNFKIISLSGDKKLYVGCLNLDNSSTWLETSTDVSTKLTDAYLPSGRGFNIVIRQIEKRKFEVYDNGYLLGTFETPFDINNIGGIMNHNYGTNIGVNQWGLVNSMYEYLKYGSIGDDLNIAVFGDSITESEGTSICWGDYLGKYLKGQRGITNVNVDNFAISGATSTSQYSVMQTKMTNAYNVVCILIGTNDIQGQPNINTFKSTISNMIDSASQFNAKVIIGLPPMYISHDLTQSGFTPSNYQKGIAYRECIKFLASTKGVTLADTITDIGRIGIDNAFDILRDNLHPNTYTQITIMKCFARSILNSFSKDLTAKDLIYDIAMQDTINLTLNNSWVNNGGAYSSATASKNKSGIVTLNGLIKGGTYTGGTNIATIPVGYRPSTSLIFPIAISGGVSMLEVRADGNIYISSPLANNTWLSLNGITYLV